LVTNSKKVMIVDDDPSVREILKVMLKDFEIVEASNGQEAIKKFIEERPRIVLMDIVMPGVDGIKATQKIKQIDPETLVIGITAFGKAKSEELIKAGASEVLTKPLTKRRLLEIIRDYQETSKT